MVVTDAQGDEWEEKWGEWWASMGRANKWADKWAKDGTNVWHEKWGEEYDGEGGCVKFTDKVCPCNSACLYLPTCTFMYVFMNVCLCGSESGSRSRSGSAAFVRASLMHCFDFSQLLDGPEELHKGVML